MMKPAPQFLVFLLMAVLELSSSEEVEPKAVLIRPEVRSTHRFEEDSEAVIEDAAEKAGAARIAREAHTCRYPTKSEDSEIFCKIYPSKIVCKQTCMFGYTFPEGIQRVLSCHFDEDQWMPKRRFEQCQPYVDCTLSLGPGGSMKCFTHYMKHGPICEVDCKHYEDQAPVPRKTYRCDHKGDWSPSLPHCVSPGTGVSVVPPPRSVMNNT